VNRFRSYLCVVFGNISKLYNVGHHCKEKLQQTINKYEPNCRN
jgi:hypothetical protein